MSERSSLDRSAILVAAVTGLVLMAVGIPFLPAFYCESPSATCSSPGTEYAVAWTTAKHAEGTVALTNDAGQEATVMVGTTKTIPAKAIITTTACDDQFLAGLQGESTITVSLAIMDGGMHKPIGGTQTFTCADDASFSYTVDLLASPDKVVAKGDGKADASKALNATTSDKEPAHEYMLTVKADRGASTLPSLPGTAPSFSAAFKLEIQGWTPVLADKTPTEVGK